MITAKGVQDRIVAALVCVLVIGIFTLASEAKWSQYRSGSPSEGYLSKATKMSGDGCQTVAVVVPRVAPQIVPCDAPAHVVVRAWDPRLPKAVALDSFRNRPPPACVA